MLLNSYASKLSYGQCGCSKQNSKKTKTQFKNKKLNKTKQNS